MPESWKDMRLAMWVLVVGMIFGALGLLATIAGIVYLIAHFLLHLF